MTDAKLAHLTFLAACVISTAAWFALRFLLVNTRLRTVIPESRRPAVFRTFDIPMHEVGLFIGGIATFASNVLLIIIGWPREVNFFSWTRGVFVGIVVWGILLCAIRRMTERRNRPQKSCRIEAPSNSDIRTL